MTSQPDPITPPDKCPACGYGPDDLEVEDDGRVFDELGVCCNCNAESRRLAPELRQAQERAPKCAHCGKPATCFGVYEDDAFPPEYACDECCGHGNEDGWCKEVGREMGELAAYYLRNREYAEADGTGDEKLRTIKAGFIAAKRFFPNSKSLWPKEYETIRAAVRLCEVPDE